MPIRLSSFNLHSRLRHGAAPHLPLSEIYDHALMYHTCNLIFVAATCWCAVAKSLALLVAARSFAGWGGSSVFALAPSSVADMAGKEKRGSVMAVVMVAYILAPSMSPLVGSHVGERWGWRRISGLRR